MPAHPCSEQVAQEPGCWESQVVLQNVSDEMKWVVLFLFPCSFHIKSPFFFFFSLRISSLFKTKIIFIDFFLFLSIISYPIS